LQRFPRLHAQLIEVVSELLRERLGPTSDYTQSLIEIQAAYINTNHPSFISASEPSNQFSRPQIPQQVCYWFLGSYFFHSLIFFKPESPEAVNGHKPVPEDDEDETLSDDGNSIFPPRDGRSVSSTLHDRSRSNVPSALSTTKPPAATVSTVAKRSSSKSRTHRASAGGSNLQTRPPPPGFDRGGTVSTGSSPPAGSARETFLNYFFGQSGPGPIAGSSVERTHHHGHGSSEVGRFVPVGRDVSGAEVSISSGLMAGKRVIDGNSAAYDMKSLGRHIEAVSKIKI
jgi:dynamin 1-like protein